MSSPAPSSREKHYSLGEEIAHSLSHGLGIILAIIGLCVLVVKAALHGTPIHVVAAALFGSTMILLYTASTLYHSIPLPKSKQVLRVVDHAAIYLLIAGTYTPFTLVTLPPAWGWPLFATIWGLALLGVGFKLFYTGRFRRLSTAIYLVMGWCGIVAIHPLLQTLPSGGLWLLLGGGLAYTGGAAFYLMERLRYHHAIWHLFVLLGTVLHYFAVLLYVLPGPV